MGCAIAGALVFDVYQDHKDAFWGSRVLWFDT